MEHTEDDDLWTCHWCGDDLPLEELRNYGDELVCEDCWESRHDCRMCDGTGGGMNEWKCPYCHGTGISRESVEREREG